MAKFDEDQAKEIQELVRKVLGLDEDQTLADAVKKPLAEVANAAINAYDKRAKKERDGTIRTLLGLEEGEESLTAKLQPLFDLAKKKPDPKLPTEGLKGLEGIDLEKLDPGVRAVLASMHSQVQDLTKAVQDQRTEAEKAAARAKESEQQREKDALREALRSGALNKDALGFEFDSVTLDLLTEHLMPKIRPVKDGRGFELETHYDEALKEPVFASLTEGLKKFGATELGQRFRRPVAGAGNLPPGGPTPPAEGKTPASQLVGKPPSEIDKLAREGKIDYTA